ncbi:aminocarboxymuconate-semialdehyde decarboxylase [Hydrogenophaga palleronii]|uniref:Aminocarboxymuconate-semialdehyde decarboxylase n=1 Tax=Hydrogenophaga palleronii TaxID=65655 RepID=A0ABU1WPW5_9BURK|nr:amidohydrolase family protein [Hydrogenophaga palleronii]MDR7151340.1 aminocarboxymuconate-semialdehyde decarboxylase [Hydrogenophaga palleronii]
MDVIDFHCHFAGSGIPIDASRGNPPAQKEFWDGVSRRLTQEEALLASLQTAGITSRVINTSLEFVLAPGEEADLDTVRRINDSIADVTHRHSAVLHGLATVDAYRREASARELTRAVRELGLKGVFIESAKGDLLPDAPEARPTFLAASELGVPVFLHPVPDAVLRQKFGRTGKFSERLSRSAINSAALLAMANAGMFEEMPNLNVVVTALALGGLMVGECLADGAQIGKHAFPRRNVYIDTTGLHSVLLRAAVDLVGADHVVMGTDWPVVTETNLPARLTNMFDQCGLGEADRDLIAHANARRLLHV